MSANPDNLPTPWQRLAGAWRPYWEGMVKTIKAGSALGQRDRCMLDLCDTILELADRVSRIEKSRNTSENDHEEINQLKEGLARLRSTVIARLAGGQGK